MKEQLNTMLTLQLNDSAVEVLFSRRTAILYGHRAIADIVASGAAADCTVLSPTQIQFRYQHRK